VTRSPSRVSARRPAARTRWRGLLPVLALALAFVTLIGGCASFPDNGPKQWRDTVEGGGPLAAPPRIPDQPPDSDQPPPPPASLIRGSFAGSGQTPRISGDTLSFHDQRKQGALSSFKVQRPAFWNTYVRCLKKADANKADMPVMRLMGPWVWISENHQEASFFNVAGGAISIWSIPPSVGADLLKN